MTGAPFAGLVVLVDVDDADAGELLPAMWVEPSGDAVDFQVPAGLVLAVRDARDEIARLEASVTRFREAYLLARSSG